MNNDNRNGDKDGWGRPRWVSRGANALDSTESEEDRLWREARRVREERRLRLEREWRENGGATHGARAIDVRKAEWRMVMRWRRQIQAVCSDVGLTFTQWLVLDAARELIRETGDAVIQNEIAARLGLDQVTISGVTQRLVAKALVSRGESATGVAWRVFLTEEAESLLTGLEARLEAASSSG